SLERYLAIDTFGVDARFRRRAIGSRQRVDIVAFGELDERAGERGIFEHPVLAAARLEMRAQRPRAREEPVAVRQGHNGPVERQRARHDLESGLGERFELLLHERQELVRDRAVDQTVIEAQRQVRARADRDRILAILALDHFWTLLDRADAHDRDLRLVNDGRAQQRPENAGVRDRERALFHFLGLEALGARPVREVVQLARNADHAQLIRVLDDRNDQAPVERDGDSNVVLLAVDHIVAGDRRIQRRELTQTVDRGLDDERHERETLTRGSLELRALFRADSRDSGEINLEYRRDVSRRAAREDHVVADQRAHLAHRLDDIAFPRFWERPFVDDMRRRWCGRPTDRWLRRTPMRDQRFDVSLRDATRDAGAAHG